MPVAALKPPVNAEIARNRSLMEQARLAANVSLFSIAAGSVKWRTGRAATSKSVSHSKHVLQPRKQRLNRFQMELRHAAFARNLKMNKMSCFFAGKRVGITTARPACSVQKVHAALYANRRWLLLSVLLF
jgi:hypothetical protein